MCIAPPVFPPNDQISDSRTRVEKGQTSTDDAQRQSWLSADERKKLALVSTVLPPVVELVVR